MLGWLGALAHNPDDPLHQRIHYDQPARTVKQLLADLSRQTGITLFAPSPLDTEIVLVSVQQMPLKTLMEHLATVTDGEWVKQPNGSYHLIRSPKLARECRERDDAQLLQGLKRAVAKKGIERLAEPLTEAQVRQIFQQIKRQMQEIESQEISNPWKHPLIESLEKQVRQLDVGQRLIIRLVRRLDLRRLLTIPVGERRVFSNVRGRYLEPFGFEVGSLLAEYQREARWVYQAWTHPLDGFDEEWVKRFNQRYGYMIKLDYQWRQEPSQVPLTRLYLEVRRIDPDCFSFAIVLVSEDLKQSVRGYLSCYEFSEQEERDEADRSASGKPSQSQASQQSVVRVAWSELSRQFMEAYRAIERATEPVAFPDVLDPAKVEPLSLVPSDVLRTYARQKGKSLIALVPDNLFWWLNGALEGHDALQMYEENIRRWHDMQEQGDVLLLKPRWSSYWWGRRADRLALSRWMQQLRQRGYPKLEDHLTLLQMYDRAGFEIMRTVFIFYRSLLLPEDFSLMIGRDCRLLNQLSAKQLAHLLQGGALTLKELSPVQREQLARDIYFGAARLEKVFSPNKYPAPVESEKQEIADVSLPHVFYPDGLPDDLTLQRDNSDRGEKIGVFTTRRAGIWGGFYALRDLADVIYHAEEPSEYDNDYLDELQMLASRYKAASLMPAHRKTFRLEVRLGTRHAILLPMQYGFGLLDYELLNEGKPATLDTLPDELKTAFERYLQEWKERRSKRE
jgi:hypothetical protein